MYIVEKKIAINEREAKHALCGKDSKGKFRKTKTNKIQESCEFSLRSIFKSVIESIH
jgi:hypothetical protein